jgi:hypothetical protein
MIFRIDDVSVNTDLEALEGILDTIKHYCPFANFLLAVSPMVHDLKHAPVADRERAFPRILSAMSDHRNFFKVDHAGIPEAHGMRGAQFASHGLVHVDHRLMGREAQELSIVTSCSVLHTKVFVPPFNKYNADTESVCAEHGLELVRFEDGWRHVNYNDFDSGHDRYYFHTHDVTTSDLDAWFGARGSA